MKHINNQDVFLILWLKTIIYKKHFRARKNTLTMIEEWKSI